MIGYTERILTSTDQVHFLIRSRTLYASRKKKKNLGKGFEGIRPCPPLGVDVPIGPKNNGQKRTISILSSTRIVGPHYYIYVTYLHR